MNFRFHYFSDKNGVITGKMGSHNFATQLEERAFEDRDSAGSPAIVNGEALLSFGSLGALREVFGDGFVAFLENADPEPLIFFQSGKNRCSFFNANQNQQWVERNGSEGIGGHAAHRTGSALDGDNGDSRCEMAERLAKLMRSEQWRFHLWSF